MKVTAVLAVTAATLLSLTEASMVCYFASWAFYRNGDGQFDVEDIDPFLCTEIVWAFSSIGDDNKIHANDPKNDLCDDGGRCGYDRFTGLKTQNPDLKTTLSVNGAPSIFSQMAADPTARKTFADSCLDMLNEHNFTGLDVDWESPTKNGGGPQDKENFVLLLQDLRTTLHAADKTLTIAASASKHTIDAAFDVPGVSAAVDAINIMAYDLHGSWETHTNHHTILYPYPQEPASDQYLNVDYAVSYWLQLGAPANKLVLGTATYGHCWKLNSESNYGMYAPADAPSDPGPYTQEAGILAYNEICVHNLTHAWTVVNEKDMNEPYAYDFAYDNAWCGYDDSNSLATKGQYAAKRGLAGMMVWTVDMDDFTAQCNPRPFNLIKSMYEAFNGNL